MACLLTRVADAELGTLKTLGYLPLDTSTRCLIVLHIFQGTDDPCNLVTLLTSGMNGSRINEFIGQSISVLEIGLDAREVNVLQWWRKGNLLEIRPIIATSFPLRYIALF